jgi:hypothetical protein
VIEFLRWKERRKGIQAKTKKERGRPKKEAVAIL